jgi:hypothetical protein
METDKRVLEEIKRLPKKRQDHVMSLYAQGCGLLEGAGFGGGMINSFWGDCVRGEIKRYLRSKGIEKETGYCNKMSDFYIDSRCGRAPRKQLDELEDELVLAINDNFHPCECQIRKSHKDYYDNSTHYFYNGCRRPTDKTAKQRQAERGPEREIWQLSEKKLSNHSVEPSSFVCYYCWQDRLVRIPKEKKEATA